ncbi:MAG: regulatory protein RecX [Lachnospiraceae bacterium]|nr:regulatory protein RecX [Lachnospiraceae bacterium]
MLVTDIVDVTKTRSRIFIDGSFAFVLYKGELRKYHIEEGKEIAEIDYSELMEKVLPKRAKLRSMNLLQSREYTEKQLKDKLLLGGYPESVAEEAIDYVKSYHYIDDDRYAATYIEYHIENKSRQRIVQDLMRKGISKECIESQWQKIEELGTFIDEEKMISEILEKKKYVAEEADIKGKQKMYALLLRKGFSSDKIRKVMNAEGYF